MKNPRPRRGDLVAVLAQISALAASVHQNATEAMQVAMTAIGDLDRPFAEPQTSNIPASSLQKIEEEVFRLAMTLSGAAPTIAQLATTTEAWGVNKPDEG